MPPGSKGTIASHGHGRGRAGAHGEAALVADRQGHLARGPVDVGPQQRAQLGQRHAREQRADRQDDQQLDQGEAPVRSPSS